MANFQKIQLTRSGTAAAVPAASDLELGELAINYADGKLFFENSSGSVVDIADINSGSGGILTADRSNNRIGINETSPSEALHVNGTIRLDGSVGQFNISGDDSSLLSRKEYIQFSSIDSNTTSGNDGARIYADATSANTNVGDLVLSMTNDGTAGGQSFVIRNERGDDSGGEGVGYSDIAYFGTDGSHQARVGIGTTTPTANLDIVSDSSTTLTIRGESTDAILQLTTSSTDPANTDGWTIRNDQSESDRLDFRYDDSSKLKVTAAGLVGIGTSSPDTLLAVVGADPILTIRDTETALASSSAILRLGESGAGDTLGQHRDLKFGANATFSIGYNDGASTDETHLVILSSGNVGIGTTSPGEKLDVSGNIAATGSITGNTLTDGTASINSGAITGATTATFSGNVTATTAPTNGDHLTNKTYVDSVAQLNIRNIQSAINTATVSSNNAVTTTTTVATTDGMEIKRANSRFLLSAWLTMGQRDAHDMYGGLVQFKVLDTDNSTVITDWTDLDKGAVGVKALFFLGHETADDGNLFSTGSVGNYYPSTTKLPSPSVGQYLYIRIRVVLHHATGGNLNRNEDKGGSATSGVTVEEIYTQ